MPRPKKTEKEIQAMRERIVDAALALLQEGDPREVSTRKIADRIGVSHMTLYGYFENRAAIIGALRERGFERMVDLCAEALRRAEEGDALVEVRFLLERFIHLSHKHPVVYQLAWRRDLSMRTEPRTVTTSLNALARLIQLCVERGQCVDRNPALAAAMVFCMVNGSLLLYRNLPELDQIAESELEREMIEAAIAYLTK